MWKSPQLVGRRHHDGINVAREWNPGHNKEIGEYAKRQVHLYNHGLGFMTWWFFGKFLHPPHGPCPLHLKCPTVEAARWRWHRWPTQFHWRLSTGHQNWQVRSRTFFQNVVGISQPTAMWVWVCFQTQSYGLVGKVTTTRCFLLGAGTLSCYLARTLMVRLLTSCGHTITQIATSCLKCWGEWSHYAARVLFEPCLSTVLWV